MSLFVDKRGSHPHPELGVPNSEPGLYWIFCN